MTERGARTSDSGGKRKRSPRELMKTKLKSRADGLAEDVYEHFLRESCDSMIDGEWYEMALAVADRFRELILHSEDRN